MTQFLSSILGAVEPYFSNSLRNLEHAAGMPAVDIRLTQAIKARTRTKIIELGLDPADTTAEELYSALKERLGSDDTRLLGILGYATGEQHDDAHVRIRRLLLRHVPAAERVFAIKPSVIKRLLKKKSPNATMRQLGYRSLDSMLKHEPAAQIMLAVAMCESATWQRGFREMYAKLKSGDFETRSMQLYAPTSKRWLEVSARFVEAAKTNVVSVKEMGVLGILPVPPIPGAAITCLMLALEERNNLRAASACIKLQQVQPLFGKVVKDVSAGAVSMHAHVAGQPIDWQLVQRYYAKHPGAYHPDIFEPHIDASDLAWVHAEDALADIDESLRFWQDTQALGLLDGDVLVSCNALDVALSTCNKLPFAERVTHFLHDRVWQELLLNYLHHGNLEELMRRQLSQTINPLVPEYQDL